MTSLKNEESEYIRVLTIKGANGEERRLQFPIKLDLLRPKRPRTTFSEEQLAELEEAFRTNGYLTGVARAELANKLELSDTQVKVWFQNRRTKDRRKTATESNPHKSNTVTTSLCSETDHSIERPKLDQTLLTVSNTMFTFSGPQLFVNSSFHPLTDFNYLSSPATLNSLYYRQ